MENFFQSFNNQFEPHVRGHLKNVFASLTMCAVSASVGFYIHMFTNLLSGGAIIVILLGGALALTLPDAPLPMVAWFASLHGFVLGLLELDMAVSLMLLTITCASFSGAALFAPDRKYLYLGASVLSGLSTITLLGFLKIFFGSQLVFQGYIYLRLAIFCLITMFQTEIIEACRGDNFFSTTLMWTIDFLLLSFYSMAMA